jgi:hypothetical protein
MLKRAPSVIIYPTQTRTPHAAGNAVVIGRGFKSDLRLSGLWRGAPPFAYSEFIYSSFVRQAVCDVEALVG